MAIHRAPDLHLQMLLAAEFGNKNEHYYDFARSAMAVGDQYIVCGLAPGMEIIDVSMLVTDAATATADFDVGYWDSVAAVGAGDADYWFDGQDIDALGFFTARHNGVKRKPFLITGDKPKFLVATLNTVAIAEATAITFGVEAIYRGLR